MLSDTQKKILHIISNYIEENKISPTVREIGKLSGLRSTSTVQGHLNRIEKKGYITKHPTFPRTIRIIKNFEAETVNLDCSVTTNQ